MSAPFDPARQFLAKLPLTIDDPKLHEVVALLSGVVAALDDGAHVSTRFKVTGDNYDEEVIGEPFKIDGVDEQFAVHACIKSDHWIAPWTATHVETGFAVGRGETIDGAIAAARECWLAAPAEVIASAKERAIAIRAQRDQGSNGITAANEVQP